MTKATYKAAALATYKARRADAIVALGGKCYCGSTERLTLVRRPDATEDFTVSNIWSRTPEIRTRLYAQCAVYCYEHAKGVMWGKGAIKHGAWYAAYKRKCDCGECAEYRKVYAAQRRADRTSARVAAGLPAKRTPKPKAAKPPKPKAPPKPKRPTFAPTVIPAIRPFTAATDLVHLHGRKFPSVAALRDNLKRALQKHMGCIPPANGPDRLYEELVAKGWVELYDSYLVVKVPSQQSIYDIVHARRAATQAADADLLGASEVLND